uniref:F-box domain-containing protein n=1 Tax=Brassica oleracea var. oleracea TaxID=109376 RepID=A0A0D3C1W2_BRAOL
MTLSPSENTVSVVLDWSLLPEELLHVISKNLEDCFDVVHARAFYTLWRSILPFPSYLSRPSYALPTLDNKARGASRRSLSSSLDPDELLLPSLLGRDMQR